MNMFEKSLDAVDAGVFTGDCLDADYNAARAIFYTARWLNRLAAHDLGQCGREDLKLYYIAQALGFIPTCQLGEARSGDPVSFDLVSIDQKAFVSVWPTTDQETQWTVARVDTAKSTYTDHTRHGTLAEALVWALKLFEQEKGEAA